MKFFTWFYFLLKWKWIHGASHATSWLAKHTDMHKFRKIFTTECLLKKRIGSFYSFNVLIFSHVTIKLDYNKYTVVKASLHFFYITDWGLIVIKNNFSLILYKLVFRYFVKSSSVCTHLFSFWGPKMRGMHVCAWRKHKVHTHVICFV